MGKREKLPNGDLYCEMQHAGLLITADGRGIINLNSRDYGYHQFTFSREQLEKYDVEARKSELIRKYKRLIEWLDEF